jgi:hypothetical protein
MTVHDGDELAMRRALKILPPGDLVRAIDTTTELLAHRPPDRTSELRALAETRAVVAAACLYAAAAIGEGRTTPGDLERLNGRLADLDTRRQQLEREQEACVRWDQDHAPQFRRAQLAGQELMARHAARLTALEHVPLDTWRHSVATIERLRTANGVDQAEVEQGRDASNKPQELLELTGSQVDLTQAQPAHPWIERADGLAVDL